LPVPPSFQCEGQVLWNGCPPGQHSRVERVRAMAWMPQDDPLAFDCTVMERVQTAQFLARSALAWETQADYHAAVQALAQFDVADKAGRLLSELSGGERRRVSVAAAQFQNSVLTLLDEPLSQLDWAHQIQIGQVFRQWPGLHRKALLWVTHEPNMALRFATHLFAISQQGQVLQGPVCDMAKAEILAQVYGCEIESSTSPFLFFPRT
ncbi:MAG: ABC transporter ATP-binding protein, partial [Limnobacter sp.]|nr:ABC transporter ATP-binding protein [Limnobacter sp.]